MLTRSTDEETDMEPQMNRAVHEVPLDLIDIPKNWRRVKKETVAEIAESVKVDGLLQPIGVRAMGGRHRLVFGRHRLESFRLLGRTHIPAFVLDLDDVAERSATDAENLFRNPLSPAERLLCLKRWNQRYADEHPESQGSEVGLAVARDRLPADRAPTFAQHAADVTGVPRKTIEMRLTDARGLSEDELFTLADRQVNNSDLKALSRIADPDQKRAAIALIASGLGPKEAIATATLPANATFSEVVGEGAPVKAEADMTDQEWLETYCGDVLARLKFRASYVRDALLYRATADVRHRLRTGSKKALAQGKSQQAGPYFMLYTKFVNTDHPKNWLHCAPCGGTGMSGDNSKCGPCNGHAYTTRSGAR